MAEAKPVAPVDLADDEVGFVAKSEPVLGEAVTTAREIEDVAAAKAKALGLAQSDRTRAFMAEEKAKAKAKKKDEAATAKAAKLSAKAAKLSAKLEAKAEAKTTASGAPAVGKGEAEEGAEPTAEDGDGALVAPGSAGGPPAHPKTGPPALLVWLTQKKHDFDIARKR
jgi:hypothetical protein